MSFLTKPAWIREEMLDLATSSAEVRVSPSYLCSNTPNNQQINFHSPVANIFGWNGRTSFEFPGRVFVIRSLNSKYSRPDSSVFSCTSPHSI